MSWIQTLARTDRVMDTVECRAAHQLRRVNVATADRFGLSRIRHDKLELLMLS